MTTRKRADSELGRRGLGTESEAGRRRGRAAKDAFLTQRGGGVTAASRRDSEGPAGGPGTYGLEACRRPCHDQAMLWSADDGAACHEARTTGGRGIFLSSPSRAISGHDLDARARLHPRTRPVVQGTRPRGRSPHVSCGRRPHGGARVAVVRTTARA